MIIKNIYGEVVFEQEQLSSRFGYYTFNGLQLRDADFSGLDLRNCLFDGADLTRARFTNCNLKSCRFEEAILDGANFVGANIEHIILSGASIRDVTWGFGIPCVSNLHSQIPLNRVEMGHWHCGTTHCYAGWAIHLAGEAGYQLAGDLGNDAAGALIIARSCPYLEGQTPDFYGMCGGEAGEQIERWAEFERNKS